MSGTWCLPGPSPDFTLPKSPGWRPLAMSHNCLLIMACLRWVPLDIDVWQDDLGRVIRPLSVGTKRLKSLVQSSTLRWADRLALTDESLDGLAWTPLFLSLRKATNWSVGCLGQHLGGGSWTMSRLHCHYSSTDWLRTIVAFSVKERAPWTTESSSAPARWERLRRQALRAHSQGILPTSSRPLVVNNSPPCGFLAILSLAPCPLNPLSPFTTVDSPPRVFSSQMAVPLTPLKRSSVQPAGLWSRSLLTGCPPMSSLGLYSDWGFDGTAYEGELFAVIKAAEASSGFFRLYTDNARSRKWPQTPAATSICGAALLLP
eukprot:6479644-Amphidinium_carterae.1